MGTPISDIGMGIERVVIHSERGPDIVAGTSHREPERWGRNPDNRIKSATEMNTAPHYCLVRPKLRDPQ